MHLVVWQLWNMGSARRMGPSRWTCLGPDVDPRLGRLAWAGLESDVNHNFESQRLNTHGSAS